MCWFNEFRHLQFQSQLSGWLVIMYIRKYFTFQVFSIYVSKLFNNYTYSLKFRYFYSFYWVGNISLSHFFFIFFSLFDHNYYSTIIFKFILLLRLLFNSQTYTCSHYCWGILVSFMQMNWSDVGVHQTFFVYIILVFSIFFALEFVQLNFAHPSAKLLRTLSSAEWQTDNEKS